MLLYDIPRVEAGAEAVGLILNMLRFSWDLVSVCVCVCVCVCMCVCVLCDVCNDDCDGGGGGNDVVIIRYIFETC